MLPSCIAIFLCVAAGVLFVVVRGAVTDLPAPGGFNPIPSDDPHLQPSVNFAAANVNRRSNCAYCQTVVGVCHAEEKVVSGFIYDFTLTMQQSDKCFISKCYDNVSSAACPPDPAAKAYDCHATVLAAPWRTPPFVLQDLECKQ